MQKQVLLVILHNLQLLIIFIIIFAPLVAQNPLMPNQEPHQPTQVPVCSPADILITYMDPSRVLKAYFCHSF
jgi:hypothetical protein